MNTRLIIPALTRLSGGKMMRITVLTVAAAVTCGLTCTAQALEDYEKYSLCQEAALKRAGPKNCPAYQEAISCGNKTLQVLTSERARRFQRSSLYHARAAARIDGCKVG